MNAQLESSYDANWEARKRIGDITANVPVLIGFMALFAAVAGPGNLFLFAGRGRRHRLFWTTPLISLGASVILYLLIVLNDGFGGSGLRYALVHLLPSERKSVVLQEQVARTGVVRASAFDTRAAAFIAPIAFNDRSNAAKRAYRNSETRFEGDWFTSRSVQAHWMESIASSRAEVALLNAGEVRESGAAPIILSTISAPLAELYFLDEKGMPWRASNVRTGERTTLARVEKLENVLPREAGPRLRAMWEKVKNQPGHFYALTSDPSALIATLPSLRWQDQRAIYFGAISTGVSP